MTIWMGNKEQGRARTCGDAEEEPVSSRGHVLPEEGVSQNHLQDRTAQDRARLVVRQQQLRWVKNCKALAGEYVTTQHRPVVVFEVRMKKWKEKRTMGPNHIKWWTCKDEMIVEYR